MLGVIPAAVAAVTLFVALRRSRRRWLPYLVTASACFSLLWTVASLLIGGALAGNFAVGLFPLTETGAMVAALAVVVARGPAGPAASAAALTVAASSAIVTRAPGASLSAVTILGMVVWGLLAAIAIALGLWGRSAEARHVAEVGRAQQVSRLQLAAELHDYVAHDVSEMLALAQAGQVLTADGNTRAAAMFVAIEEAAQRSMRSLDRTVTSLADRAPGLQDVPELVRRFGRAQAIRANADLDGRVCESVDQEVSSLAYRLVVEALTNVRRHARGAGQVGVQAVVDERTVHICVVDDGGPADPGPGRRQDGGRGLAGLRHRAEALGGSLVAGPVAGPVADSVAAPGGWRVALTLPLRP